MTTFYVVASVWAALSSLALMFVRGATAKPSIPRPVKVGEDNG